MVDVFDGDVRVTGELTANSFGLTVSSITNSDIKTNAAIARSKLAQDTLQPFTIPLTQFRTWDALAVNLPGTPAADDLGLDNATFGTGSPHLTTGDLGAAGATSRYARVHVPIPAEYDDGATCNLVVHAGMLTAVADASCVVDVECYRSDEATGISADLCTTAATTCNSLTFADLSFSLTPTTFVSGDTLDIRVTITCTDAATAVVEGVIGAAWLACDIKG
jgi:hypothetical protein